MVRAAAHARSLRAGDGVDGLGVEREELGEGGGVGHRAGLVGELLDPDGRLVEQLVGDPAHGVEHLGAGRVVEVGQPADEPLHLGVDDRGRHRAERDHGRRDAGLAARGEERRDLLGHDPRGPPRPRWPASESRSSSASSARLIRVTPGRSPTRGLDVVRQREVDDRELAAVGGRGATISAVTMTPLEPVQETTTSASASSASQVGQQRRAGAVLGGEALGVAGGPVGHGDAGGAAARDGRGGEAGHRAGAEHQDPLAGEVADGGVAAVERGRDQRGRGAVDVGLGAGALADAQGLLEEHVEATGRRCRSPGPG